MSNRGKVIKMTPQDHTGCVESEWAKRGSTGIPSEYVIDGKRGAYVCLIPVAVPAGK